MPYEVPPACTLPTAAQPLRLAEFQALFASALRRQERLSDVVLQLTLSSGDGLEGAVRDLTARESGCCSFFDFTITPTATGVVLDIGVPAAHASVLDVLADIATDAAPAASR
jgi:hypothetical protein